MTGPYTYVYLVGSLLFVPVWVLLYWRTPSARREMLHPRYTNSCARPWAQTWRRAASVYAALEDPARAAQASAA